MKTIVCSLWFFSPICFYIHKTYYTKRLIIIIIPTTESMSVWKNIVKLGSGQFVFEKYNISNGPKIKKQKTSPTVNDIW